MGYIRYIGYIVDISDILCIYIYIERERDIAQWGEIKFVTKNDTFKSRSSRHVPSGGNASHIFRICVLCVFMIFLLYLGFVYCM